MADIVAKKIRAASAADIHKLTSGQVIIDLQSSVKELIENSLDAEATNIEIVFRNYGLESVEVSDNGTGISSDNLEAIALKYHTSKISGFQDIINNVTTYGFRGEAMSSLCFISDVKMITATKDTTPKGTVIDFNHSGEVKSKRIGSRGQGTTTTISNLFANLPVRRKIFLRHLKREFTKAITLVQAYCIICEKVKISVYSTTNGDSKKLLFSTNKTNLMKDNIISIYGSSIKKSLMPVNFEVAVSAGKSLKIKSLHDDFENSDTQREEADDMAIESSLLNEFVAETDGEKVLYHFSGYISYNSYGLGRNNSDRQMMFINHRPVSLPRFTRVINEAYRSYNRLQYPIIFLNIKVDPKHIDINVTPDKKTINFFNEASLLEELKKSLNGLYEAQAEIIPSTLTANFDSPYIPQKNFSFHKLDSTDKSNKPESSKKIHEGKMETRTSPEIVQTPLNLLVSASTTKEDNESEAETTVSDILDTSLTRLEEKPIDCTAKSNFNDFAGLEKTVSADVEKINDLAYVKVPDLRLLAYNVQSRENEDFRSGIEAELSLTAEQDVINSESIDSIKANEEKEKQEGDKENESALSFKIKQEMEDSQFHRDISHSFELSSPATELIQSKEPESLSNLIAGSLTKNRLEENYLASKKYASLNYITVVSNDMQKARKKFKLASSKAVDKPNKTSVRLDGLTNLVVDDINTQEDAESRLSLAINKTDFLNMKIIGQFNLGFILVVKQSDKELFIIDQHASDEKYNFETLSKNTVIQSQPLVVPKELDLNSIDKLIVMDNLDVFAKNGFNVVCEKRKLEKADDDGIEIEDACESKLYLKSLPTSKRTVFKISDFNELVTLIKENQDLESEKKIESLQISKIRSMFAMRACRKSIMVGRALDEKTMVTLVRHLHGLDKPWNCPHGRPTMRHLTRLSNLTSFDEDYTI